jgi:low temperature requirement protein LtrA
VLVSVTLIAGLWWVYFGADDSRGGKALSHVEPERMAHEAIQAYFVAHLLHIAGLVLVAAGLHVVVHDPAHQLDRRIAVTLAAGCAAYLAGEILYRARLDLGGLLPLLVGAVACLLTPLLGVSTNGLAQLLALALLVIVLVVGLEMDERRGSSGAERGADTADA